jgi:hypothetical protein
MGNRCIENISFIELRDSNVMNAKNNIKMDLRTYRL